MPTVRTLDAAAARRITLDALGLGARRPERSRRAGVRGLRAVLDRLDVVQLDSVDVLARAHELPFWSRLGAHDRAARDRWLWQHPRNVESYVHEASVVPVEVWPLLAHRRAEFARGRHVTAVERAHPGELDRVEAEVRAAGPRSIRELTDPGRRTGPWWGMARGRLALDALALTGRLVVHHRDERFVITYDVPERVLPADVLATDPPTEAEARAALLLRAARAQGIGTAGDLADHHRQRVTHVRGPLAGLVAAGELEEVRVTGWGAEPAYVLPGTRVPRSVDAATLVSPFDPVAFHRPRLERAFGFRYRIELYVPAARRVHGYYVLPFLLDDRFVARVDLKAHRRDGRLEVRGAFAEEGIDRTVVARELAVELSAMAAWLGLGQVEVARHGDLAPALTRALR